MQATEGAILLPLLSEPYQSSLRTNDVAKLTRFTPTASNSAMVE